VPQTGTPVIAAAGGFGVPLFAHNGVVREPFANEVADHPLGLAVGLGDRVEANRPFIVDDEGRAKARQRHRRGDLRRIEEGPAYGIGVKAGELTIVH